MKNAAFRILLLLIYTLGNYNSHAQCSFSVKASVTEICEKEVVQFSIVNAPSSSIIKEINWDFGFKQVKNDANPTIIFTTAGTFDIKLNIKFTSNTECTVEEVKMIKVNQLPDMGQVVSSKKEACGAGSVVQFSSTSTDAVKWDWVVESEYYTGTNSNIKHKFENDGWPYVQLTVESPEGCKNKLIFDSLVHVLAKPKVDLSQTVTLLCELPGTLKVEPKFDYRETPIKSYAWGFEGATVSSDYSKIPSNKYYNQPGQFDISLLMTSNQGCKFEYLFKDTVDVVDIAKANVYLKALTNPGCPTMRYCVMVDGLDPELFKWEYPVNDVIEVDSTEKDSTVFLFKTEGTHTVKLVLNHGPCKKVFTLKMKAEKGKVTSKFSAPDCFCDPFGDFKAINKSTGTSRLTYDWVVHGPSKKTYRSTDSNFTKAFGQPGIYQVFLKATEKGGCYDWEGKKVRIRRNEIKEDDITKIACLTEVFSLSADSFCEFEQDGVFWYFYDRNHKLISVDTGQAKVNFPDTGYYSVAAVIRSKTGCIDSVYFNKHIYVYDCFGDIGASFKPTQGCAGSLKIEVGSTSITQFKVDAVFVLQSDTTVTYKGTFKFPFIIFNPNKAGVYNLKVRVSSKDGSVYKDYYIKNIATVNKLTVKGEIGKSWGCFPEKYTALRTISVVNEMYYGTDTSVSVQWKLYPFDKGKILNDKARNTKSVVYEQGQVDIELKAYNKTGCEGTWQSVNKLNDNLKLEFFMPENACFGDTIFMNNQSTGPIASWHWKSDVAGDAFYPNEFVKKPEFRPIAQGLRTIELEIVDTNGCTSSIEKEITLVDIDLDFQVEDTTAQCTPATYFFKAEGHNVEQYEWDFGDGDQLKTKKTKKIPKIYDLRRVDPYRNTFTVTLIGSHSSGCKQKVVKPDLIHIRGPWTKFEIVNLSGCSPLKVDFQDKSKNVHKLYFDYGDRTSVDTAVSAEHIYAADTSKEVEYFRPYIVAHDKHDCRVAYYLDDTIKVYSPPVARFVATPKQGCEPLTTKLRSTSKFAQTNEWTISNTGIKDEGIKTVNILNAGVYDVQLVVKNKVGCTDIKNKLKVFTVYENPTAAFVLSDTIACLNRKLDFTSTSFSAAGISYYNWLI